MVRTRSADRTVRRPLVDRSSVKPVPSTKTLRLRGRFYSFDDYKPRPIDIDTCCGAGGRAFAQRFAYTHIWWPRMTTHPYIRSCTVEVIVEFGDVYYFKVFYRTGAVLPVNSTVDRAGGLDVFRGDFIVMKLSICNKRTFVNFRAGDTDMSDFLVSQFATTLQRNDVIPDELVFFRRADD